MQVYRRQIGMFLFGGEHLFAHIPHERRSKLGIGQRGARQLGEVIGFDMMGIRSGNYFGSKSNFAVAGVPLFDFLMRFGIDIL